MAKKKAPYCNCCKKKVVSTTACYVCERQTCLSCCDPGTGMCLDCKKKIDATMNFDTVEEFAKGVSAGASIRG